MNEIWCNGVWRNDLPASPLDRGHLHGLGLFETLLAVDGVPRFAPRHLRRLANGCEILGWSINHPNLPEIMVELLRRNGLTAGRARIRVTLTAGSGALADLSPGDDQLLWMAAFESPDPPVSLSVLHSPWLREAVAPLSGLKCASYAAPLFALHHARRLGYDETLFTTAAGHLCEAAMANVFIVKSGGVFTPSLDSGCLPGIAREVILELSGGWETRLSWDDLESADEVFLTSATAGPVAVTRIGDRIYPAGSRTAELAEIWQSQA